MAKMASGDLSLTSTSSQEEEGPEYVGYDRTLRPPSNSSGSTSATNMANNNSGGGVGVGVGVSLTNNNNSNNGLSSSNTHAKKYDAIKKQYDAALMELTTLRHQHSDTVRRCDDLASQLTYMAANSNVQANANPYYGGDYSVAAKRGKCDGTCAESEKLLEELDLCRERNNDLIKERSVIAAELEKYKKNYNSTLIELDNLKKKDRIYYRESLVLKKENQNLSALLEVESEKGRQITTQRRLIEQELNQLLSEKDHVLQEHQKMSDDLSVANKELEQMRKDELMYKNELKVLQQANAELKKRDLLKSRESSWSKELTDSKDDFKEFEKLRKGLEKAQFEVERAVQDMEEAKSVRDWAISQREKIVQERDSVKTLCDNLRKERDKAISDLLSAIRDSEKIKKQKDEAQKKIDVLKEQIENQNIDSTSRRSFRMSTYEAEDMLDIELCNYHADGDIGIILDDTNNRQLVCGVTNTSPASGKLKINDVICKVNSLDCQSMTKRMVLDEIRASAPHCNLLVSRMRHSKRHFYTVHLNLQDNNTNHGLSLDTGIFISKIEQNSLAAFEPELDVGDRVLSINNKSMDGVHSVDDVMALLNDERNESITLFALKNVQDVGYMEAQRRMTTSSAQTDIDSIDSMHRVTASKHPSKISEILSKFLKLHPSKAGSESDHVNEAFAALDSVLSENSSEKSKENLFKRGKRSKKEKEAAAKSMGTWPRTNILNASHENPTGTIVHREKKRAPLSLFTAGPINVDKDDEREPSDEPPPLPPQSKPPASMRNGNATAIKSNPHRNSNPIPVTMLFKNAPVHNGAQLQMAGVVGNGSGGGGSGGGVGVGVGVGGGMGIGVGVGGVVGPNGSANYMRHSVYGAPTPMEQEPLIMEQTKPLQRPAPIMGANMRVKMPPPDKYGNQRAQNIQNRYSLNITPTESYKTSGQQAQQQVINNSGIGGAGGGGGIGIGVGVAAGAGGVEYFARKHQLVDMFSQPLPSKPLPGSKMPAPIPIFHNPMNFARQQQQQQQQQSPHLQHQQQQQQLHHQQHQQQQQQQQQHQHQHQLQQNSLDMISLKSQNSIDSILSAKSPPISEYAMVGSYPKRGMPMPQSATPVSIVKNVAKYPSDSESIASGIVSGSGNVGGFFHATNGPPPPPPANRHTQLFPTFTTQTSTHPHTHAMRQIRHSSPLTLPSPPPLHTHPHAVGGVAVAAHASLDAASSSAIGIPTSVDKFELEYVSPAHNHHHHPHAAAFLHDYTPASMVGAPPPASSSSHNPHYHHTHGGGSGGGAGGGGVGGVIYEGGTFPRKKEHQRLRIPSNPSVASKSSGVKNSSGSIDHHFGGVVGNMPTPVSMASVAVAPLGHHAAVVNAVAMANGIGGGGIGSGGGGGGGGGGGSGGSGRGSPMPQVHVEVLSHGGSKRNSNVPADFLCPGDLRRVTIEKSDKSLGITIQCNNNGGGIFVSTVADKSIATRAGLQVGDQLLEVCGLNMRSATNDIAANVLRQCGNSITMLVQYNPEKFHSAEYDGTNNLEPESPVNHSGSPTPRNSPRPPVRAMMSSLPPMPIASPVASIPSPMSQSNIIPPPGAMLSAQSIKDQSFADSLENHSDMSSSQDIPSSAATTTTSASTTSTVYEEEARYVTLHMDKSKNLGIKLFGGNKVGIFVHDVHPSSPSDRAGIRKGDQILEYNGVDLRCVTAEQAANEISKLTDTVTMLVQNKLKKLKQIKDKSGDSFYIRVGFDRTGDLNDGDLRFVKDEVLYVDNTVFNGTFGLWRAWKLDAKGHRKECGIIPSQMKVEEELRSGEVVECESGTARRSSTSARRSFFRRKKHQRSSSRDSTEIASFSNTQLSFFPDSGMLNDDGGILSYQRVERLDSPVRRPVLIIGPLSECVMDRLTIDFSNLFKLCEVTSMDCSQEAMEEGLQENIFVDYRRRGNKFECTTVEAINNACKNDRRHCILDISISAVERLQRLQIYPIVLLLRFKSAKQIREIRDFGIDKISAKAAKEMYERALRLETDYKQYISAVIPGVSIKHMCTQIKDSVDKEQDKLLWVPVSNA